MLSAIFLKQNVYNLQKSDHICHLLHLPFWPHHQQHTLCPSLFLCCWRSFANSLNPPSTLLVWPSTHWDHVSRTDKSSASTAAPLQLLLLLLLLCFHEMFSLSNIIHCHAPHLHVYADDIQIYIATKSITNETVSTLTNCPTEWKAEEHSNFLNSIVKNQILSSPVQ